MTQMIYRGTAFTRSTVTTARVARALVYRGVAHDGCAPRVRRAAGDMVYRGVAYAVLASGQRVVADVIAGQPAPA